MLEDGSSRREHLESRWSQTGKRPRELDEVGELPNCMEYVWSWFLALCAERQQTDMGTQKPLSSEQVLAWQRLNGVQLSAFELRAIWVLDGAFMAATRAKRKETDRRDNRHR